MRRFVLSLGYVALAVLEFERHKLEGILAWYAAQLSDDEHLIRGKGAARGSVLKQRLALRHRSPSP
jgi:hypothetical protein